MLYEICDSQWYHDVKNEIQEGPVTEMQLH